MSAESFVERVVRLEAQMSELQEVPAKVHDLTLQVSQLRIDMGGEFSAIRQETQALRGEVLSRLDIVKDDLRGEMRVLHEDVLSQLDDTRREMRVLHEEVFSRLDIVKDDLRGEMRVLHEDVLSQLDDTRREMRVLHEEVLSRIALLGEGSAKSSGKKTRRRKG